MIPISIVWAMIAIGIIRAMIVAAVGVIRTMIAVVTAVPAVICAPIHSPVDARDTEWREGATYSGLGGVKRQTHLFRW